MSLSTILEGIAPALATALSGPLAGIAISTLSQSIFGHKNATTNDIESSLASISPDVVLKLQLANQQFQLENQQLNLQQTIIPLENTESARQADVNMTKATGRRDYMRPILAFVMVLGFFITIGLVGGLIIYKIEIPTSISVLMGGLIAQITLEVKNIYNFYFGSSQGSKDKDNVIANNEKKFNVQ